MTPFSRETFRTKTPLFNPGHLAMTQGAQELLARHKHSTSRLLHRHITGDWGDVDSGDHKANNRSLRDGSRILSSYDLDGETLWIISEASDDPKHRPSTTLLLPEDY